MGEYTHRLGGGQYAGSVSTVFAFARYKCMTMPKCPKPKPDGPVPLPMSPEEVARRGWDAVDVVFVTGDAYVDHPSFAMALLGRLIEAEGYRVAILSQPDWRCCRPWQAFGRPRLCYAISAGNMDSMLNHYTASRKVRNDDAYSPGGRIGRRPDRATLAYCQRAREAYKGVPIIAGGVEASLRRLAHYDYWSDKVRRSILMDAKPDLLVYGMGERPLVEILRALAAGPPGMGTARSVRRCVRGCGKSAAWPIDWGPARRRRMKTPSLMLPSYEDVSTDPRAFAEMTRLAHLQSDPESARRLVQRHGREAVVVNPPAMPLSEAEMDRVYDLPFTRRPHPSYGGQSIPAFEVVKDSVQIVRGCFGGCAFCSIVAHEGRIIQSRSPRLVLAEIRRLAAEPGFSGVVSDLGGPTANMYQMNCTRPDIRQKCRRLSCLHPVVCGLLGADHGPLVNLMRAARGTPGVDRVFVASGVRMDLAQRSPAYMEELVWHHVGGHLKVAPEHSDPGVLGLMRKPAIEDFESFARRFDAVSQQAEKSQYLVPYLISGHPGCDLTAMIELALYLKRTGYRPRQVQDFIPGPMDVATCMYHTGLDPATMQPIYVPKGARERRLQRALLQFFLPENYELVREALHQADRPELIGDDPECLIPAHPPRSESKDRRPAAPPKRDPESARGAAGYRPHRRTSKRRPRK